MTSPYQPPEADLSDSRSQSRRLIHSAVALLSGLIVVPVLVFAGFRLAFGDDAKGSGNLMFWGSVCAGSVLAAFAVYPFKRTPLWAAAMIGPGSVLFVLVVWAALVYLGAT